MIDIGFSPQEERELKWTPREPEYLSLSGFSFECLNCRMWFGNPEYAKEHEKETGHKVVQVPSW